MAQTRKRRQTKHRGNAAGMIESRGRTGRKPTTAERKAATSSSGARGNRPPSWRSAINRAVLSALVLGFVLVLFLDQNIPTAFGLAAVALAFYVPIGYYTDSFIYKRRLAKDGS